MDDSRKVEKVAGSAYRVCLFKEGGRGVKITPFPSSISLLT